MDFLLFTLILGSFLIILPSPSEGQGTSVIEIPQYSASSSTMDVNCSVDLNTTPYKIVLENGQQNIEVLFDYDSGKFMMVSNPRVKTISHMDSPKKGYITFAFLSLSCSDFTWYRCKTETVKGNAYSNNKTLQVAPKITSIQIAPRSEPSVNEFSIFTCTAIVPKEASYSVRWFKGSNPSRNELRGSQTQLLRQDSCSRTINNELQYNVTQSDVPNLILTCQVNAGQIIEQTTNYTIQEVSTIAPIVNPEPVKAGLDAGSIVGIVLGVTATIVLVVLLVWFLVIRPKRLKAEPSESKTPEPYTKDYQVQDNVLYATVDPLKKQKHKSSSSSLVDGPDTNSNSVQDTGKAPKKQKSNKKSAFLPSSGDATDNMDDAYELPPPPPPPPTMAKPHQSPRTDSDNPLHYAELELAVHKSAKRRSKYTPKSNTEYADIALS